MYAERHGAEHPVAAWSARHVIGSASAAAALPELLFVVALLLHALPTALLTYFPTQDGPLHIENVTALLHRDGVEVLEQHLARNWGLQPNWLTQLLFAALTMALSPLAAQRVLLTGYVVLLPLAVRFALPNTPRGRWAALAIFPFLYSFPFHMGFWNFTYGLALFFAVVGLWRRTRGRLTAARGAGLALLLVVVFFCHATAVSASLIALGAVVGWRALLGLWRARDRRSRRRVILRAYAARVLALVLVAAPAVLLLLRFLLRHQDHHTVRLPFLTMAGRLVSLYTLVSIDRREVLFSLPLALAVAAAILFRFLRRRLSGGALLRARDGWIAAALVFVALYFATPDVAAAGSHISDRLALLPFLAALLWLGTGAGPVREIRSLAVVMLLLGVGALMVRVPRWREIDRDLEEYASIAGEVSRGTVLLPITYAPHGLAPDGGRQAWRIRPFQHAAGYVAAWRDALDLDNAQLNTDYGPVRLAKGRLPSRVLGPEDALEGDPPCVNLEAWRAAGGRLDTVLLFGATPANTRDPCSQALLATLDRDYHLAAVSQPRGLVHVFHARPTAGAQRRTASR